MGLERILIELFNPVDLLNGIIFSLKFNVYTIFYLPFKTSFKWELTLSLIFLLSSIQELHATCKAMQERIVQLISKYSQEDFITELLQVNDQLNNLFLR